MKKIILLLFNVVAFMIGLLFLYTWIFTKDRELTSQLASIVIVLAIISTVVSFVFKKGTKKLSKRS
jgi:NADH:ubiquinone oxidoreductase subunit 3 (subunit A)